MFVNSEDTANPTSDEGAPQPTGNRRRLSVIRILAVVLVVGGATAGLWFGFYDNGSDAATAVSHSWFAPYVDVTATPQYAFEEPSESTATSAVLAFVVSAHGAPCEPSWGSAYSLTAAADGLDLDRRVARLKQLGGEVTVSFGGAANSELSIGCTDVGKLTAAYRSVVDRYSADAIDLDIEGSVSSAPAVSKRRALAIAALSTQEVAAGHPVSVWLTLPVGQSGLTDEGQAVLTAMLAAKVNVAGVNGMTMDYGEPLPAGRSMADEGELALTALQQQIQSAYSAAGTELTDTQSWQRLGATPMIGQNDIPGEQFGLADAHQLVAFAQLHQLGRLSMWSANRDQGCGPNYPDVHIVSDACSGVDQSTGEFADIFREFGSGQPLQPTATSSASASASPSATGIIDDPATSPYPIWNVNQAYPKGTQIVWHRNVYQAKWYSQGDQPDGPVATAAQTPWTLVGPVLPGEHPAPTPTLRAGTYPQWSTTAVYVAGSRVLLGGVGYQAKWWNQGDRPGAAAVTPSDSSPWQLLTTP